MLFIIRTFNIILLLSAIHTQYNIENKRLCEKVFLLYIAVVFLHNFYIIPIFYLFPERYVYLDYAAPWGVMHGPLLFFSFQSLLYQKLEKKDIIIHTIPVFIMWGMYFFLLNISPSKKVFFETIYFNILYTLFLISWSGYSLYILIKSLLLKDNKVLINVLALFYILLTLFMLTLIITSHSPLSTPPEEIPNVLSTLFMSVNVILIFSISQQHLSGNYRSDKQSITNAKLTNVKEETLLEEDNRLNLDTYQIEKITSYFKSRAISDINLSIKDAATALDITQKDLTEYIKETYNLSFTRFLTEARVKLACQIMKEQKVEINNDRLASLCGFGSNATFYRNFKKITGFTPKAYYTNNIEKRKERKK